MMGQDKRSVAGRLILYWAPTVSYIVLIMVMAARPSPKLPHVKHIDKYLHALAYGVLAVLSYRSFAWTGFRRAAVMTLILGTLVGAADEGIQYLSRLRTANRYDLMADVIGVVIGTLSVLWCRRPKTGLGADDACHASERSSH
jgi:VanZ family protein